jgi:hypothetical protein
MADTEISYYTRAKQLTRPRASDVFYVIKTTWHRTSYEGRTYTSRTERVGWLKSDPANKIKFRSGMARDEWIEQVTKQLKLGGGRA